MNDQNRIFSMNLKRLLSEKRITQAEAAKAVGVSPQTFNTWVQGIAFPRSGKLQRIADYFDVYKSELIEPINEQSQAKRMVMYAAMLEKIAQLDDEDRARIDERLSAMLESEKYHEN